MTLRRSISSLAIIAACTTGVTSFAKNEEWSRYHNIRHGYHIQIPPGLKGQGESAVGDGQEFVSQDGRVKLTVWASLIISSDNNVLQARRLTEERWATEHHVKVSYRTNGKTWWTLSGTSEDQVIYYARCFAKWETNYCFEFTHPKADQVRKKQTGRIVKSFYANKHWTEPAPS